MEDRFDSAPSRPPRGRHGAKGRSGRHAARRGTRRSERGVLHGLSLVILTVVLFGLLAFIGLRQVPVRCRCSDGTALEATRGGLQAVPQRCGEVCQGHGGWKQPERDGRSKGK
jgi:hypothetical protein